MDVQKIVGGMGILIALYLFARFGRTFDSLFASGGDFVQHQTSILQGNYPFRVYGAQGAGYPASAASIPALTTLA